MSTESVVIPKKTWRMLQGLQVGVLTLSAIGVGLALSSNACAGPVIAPSGSWATTGQTSNGFGMYAAYLYDNRDYDFESASWAYPDQPWYGRYSVQSIEEADTVAARVAAGINEYIDRSHIQSLLRQFGVAGCGAVSGCVLEIKASKEQAFRSELIGYSGMQFTADELGWYSVSLIGQSVVARGPTARWSQVEVPEPGMVGLISLGLLGLVKLRRG